MSGYNGPDYSTVLGGLLQYATLASNTTIVTMTNANTEYFWDAPIGGRTVKKFTMKTRDGTAWRLAFLPGLVAGPADPYVVVPADWVYWEDGLFIGPFRIYCACGVAGKILEVIVWQ